MKQKFKNNQIQVGDEVRLLEHTEYESSASNPRMGSKYECVGTVSEIEDPDGNGYPHVIHVQWKNGEYNTYCNGDLEVVSTGFISIW